MRLVFQFPARITSVVDAPRLVNSDASPIRHECAVTWMVGTVITTATLTVGILRFIG